MVRVCDDCAIWELAKENCHFFWEGKSICTQFKGSLNDSERVRKLDDLEL